VSIRHTFNYLRVKTNGDVTQKVITKEITRGRAIYYHCLDCSGGMIKEVHRCHIKLCALYPYRPQSASDRKKKQKDIVGVG